MSTKDVINPFRYPPGQDPGGQHHKDNSPKKRYLTSLSRLVTLAILAPPPPRQQASPKVLQALGHQALVEPEGRSSGVGLPTITASLPPGCFSALPIPSSPRTQAHTGLRWGWAGAQRPPTSSSLAFSDKLRLPVGSSLLGLGWRSGMGANSDATRGLGPPPPPRPGRDRSLLLRPHYRGERPGLAEEPDGCRGRWGGLPAPWPGLNIYYVLFGLWGRGRRAVATIASCRRGGARGRGLGSHWAPRTPASLRGLGREPRTPEYPLSSRPLSGRGFAAETLGRGDRSGLPRGSGGPPWKHFPPRGRLGRWPGRGAALGDTLLRPPASCPQTQPGSETAAGARVWAKPHLQSSPV